MDCVNVYGDVARPSRDFAMMDADAVLKVIDCLQYAGVPVWLDGGWGVDALIGEQTRQHDDLDCVIALTDAPGARDALIGIGFALVEDELPTRFVVRDGSDRRVDFHTITFDAEGRGVQVLPDGTPWAYPPDAFTEEGHVGGRPVPCISAEVQVLAHLGYEPDEKDVLDLRLLGERIGIDLPEPYR